MSTISTLERTITMFKSDPTIPNLHEVAQKKYKTFNENSYKKNARKEESQEKATA